ncbi:hypothetical protein M9X92_006297 [Pyricularia oryzae]|nr:hypothetical protein M9X92_006297 [Pyricularia oryzae]
MGRVYNKSMMDQNPDIAGIGLIVPCSNAQLVHNLDRQPVSPGKLSVKSLVYKLTIVLLATSIRPIIFWTRLEFFDLEGSAPSLQPQSIHHSILTIVSSQQNTDCFLIVPPTLDISITKPAQELTIRFQDSNTSPSATRKGLVSSTELIQTQPSGLDRAAEDLELGGHGFGTGTGVGNLFL